MAELEFLSSTDKPALIALSTSEAAEICRTALTSLGYKVHTANTHEDFISRFGQIQYQAVVIDQTFPANNVAESPTLATLQWMPMNQRRHATIFLLGNTFKTLDSMQAFQQSVHAVVNLADMSNFARIAQQIIGDNDLFLRSYRDAQARLAQGKG